MKNLKFDTLQIHSGREESLSSGSVAAPIHQTTAYVFKDYDYAKNLFSLTESGHIYSRLSNPTQASAETKIAALEGGVGALAVSSGHAAIFTAIVNLASAGDEIVSSNKIYGGAINLFAKTLKKFGIDCIFVNPDDPQNFKRATTKKTKAYFVESIGNPNAAVSDIGAISKIAKECDVPLIVDGTFATPYLQRPIELGADIVIHSATKFLGGHGTAMGGFIIDSGNFNWNNGKFPDLVLPDDSYHGVSYYENFGKLAFIVKCRTHLLRDLGSVISPFNCFLLIQGMETLSLRMERHCSNSLTVAEFLESHNRVKVVNYPGLKSNAYYKLAKEILPKGVGAVFTFELDGNKEQCQKFIENLKLFLHVANVGDVRSLVIHPGTTTHSQLTDKQLEECGITAQTIRLSVGIEDVSDLICDIKNALEKAFE